MHTATLTDNPKAGHHNIVYSTDRPSVFRHGRLEGSALFPPVLRKLLLVLALRGVGRRLGRQRRRRQRCRKMIAYCCYGVGPELRVRQDLASPIFN